MTIQIQSFEAEVLALELASKEGGPETFRGVFIRAPAIVEVGPEVQVLADYPVPCNQLLGSDSYTEDQKVSNLFEKAFNLLFYGYAKSDVAIPIIFLIFKIIHLKFYIMSLNINYVADLNCSLYGSHLNSSCR